MANRYWVGGTATWDGTAGSKWSTTSGGAGGSSVPTAADDVFFDANSTGTVTLSSSAVCRSIDMTGHTGTITGVSGLSLTVGDASGGAITWGSGGTYTGNASGSRIDFVSSSTNGGAGWNLTQNGKTLSNWQYNFNNASGKWKLADDLNLSTSGSGQITHTAGEFATNDKTITSVQWQGSGTGAKTLTPGSSTINVYGNSGPFQYASTTNLTVSSNTATVNIKGAVPSVILGTFNYNGLSISRTDAGTMQISGTSGASINNLTLQSTAVKTDSVNLNAVSFTVTGALTISGNSATNRLFIANQSTRGVTSTITANGTYGTIQNADFMDIAITGSAGTMTGTSLGDCQGNSGITFDGATTQTFDGTGGNASTAARWTSRVPLPQDDVVINGSSGNITLDMPRIGKNVNFTGYTDTAVAAINLDLFGSLTLSSGMTLSNWTVTLTFGGRGSYTITTAGKSMNSSPVLKAPGGTLTQQDAATFVGAWTHTQGTWVTSSYSLTAQQFASTGSLTRAITPGTTVFTATGTGNIVFWNIATTGLTADFSSSTIALGTTSTQTRIFTGAGLKYGTLTYNNAGSTGALQVNSGNWITNFNFSDSSNARSLNLATGVEHTFVNFNVFGTSGKLMTVQSVTAGTQAFVKILGNPVSAANDYLSVKDINSQLSYKFYAGANSTNVSNNNNVIFSAAVSQLYISNYIDGSFASSSPQTISLPFSSSASAGDVIGVIIGTASSNIPSSVTGLSVVNAVVQDSTNASESIYWKVASGGETGVTITMNNANTTYYQLFVISGFTGTATLDVYDSNTFGGSSLTSLSTGAGVSNTASPAYAIAGWSKSSGFGTSTSFTNSWQENRAVTQLTNQRSASIPLNSTGSVGTTYTWQTSGTRGASRLAIFKDVVTSSATKTLAALGVG